ncbi:hypothetical protein ACKXGF_09945 [Alkalibacillus sp. S2W]
MSKKHMQQTQERAKAKSEQINAETSRLIERLDKMAGDRHE